MRVNSSLCRGCSKWLTLPADHLRSQIYSGASNSPLSAFSTDAFMMLQAANRRRWPGCTETEIRFRADHRPLVSYHLCTTLLASGAEAVLGAATVIVAAIHPAGRQS